MLIKRKGYLVGTNNQMLVIAMIMKILWLEFMFVSQLKLVKTSLNELFEDFVHLINIDVLPSNGVTYLKSKP